MEEKYIGLLLAVSSSLAIGTSFVITKKVRRLCTWGAPGASRPATNIASLRTTLTDMQLLGTERLS
jgi:hypothetical protein